jgi:hypothetical protein
MDIIAPDSEIISTALGNIKRFQNEYILFP